VDLWSWPQGSQLIVRRERPHPGAQLSFTDHDGYSFQAILTHQPDQDVAILERRHRQRARVEDRIRDDKDTGVAKLPFREFALNEVWLELVMLAHHLIVWTQALLLDGELANAKPKRLRYRLLYVAARLAFHGRRGKLRLQHDWPWAAELLAAFHSSKHSPPPAADRAEQPTHTTNPRSRPRPRSPLPADQPAQPTTPLPATPNTTATTPNAASPSPFTPRRGPPVTLARLLHDPG
jgi:hypothetical protein